MYTMPLVMSFTNSTGVQSPWTLVHTCIAYFGTFSKLSLSIGSLSVCVSETPQYLVEAPDQEVQVCGDPAKLMAAKQLVDELHLLDVGEEVPVVECQVCGYLSAAVFLGERCGWLLVLVRQRRLQGRGEG